MTHRPPHFLRAAFALALSGVGTSCGPGASQCPTTGPVANNAPACPAQQPMNGDMCTSSSPSCIYCPVLHGCEQYCACFVSDAGTLGWSCQQQCPIGGPQPPPDLAA